MRTRHVIYMFAVAMMGFEGTCLDCGGSTPGILSFQVGEPIPEQHIDGGAPGGVLGAVLPAMHMDFNLAGETAARGTGPAKVAFLNSFTLRLIPAKNPASQTFNFLDEVHIFVEANGLEKKEIATLAPVPDGQTSLYFNVDADVDLLPYINAGATLTATGAGTQPDHTVYFDGAVVVEVRI